MMLDLSPLRNKFSLSKPLFFCRKTYGALLHSHAHFILLHQKFHETKKTIIMPSTCSLSNKKRKVNNYPIIMSFKDTCIYLKLPLHLTCRMCVVKNEIVICVTSKGCQQKNNF